MQLNIFDVIIILSLIMFALVGWKKGVIKEGVSVAGIILVFIISFALKEWLGNILCKFLPFFSYSGSIEGLISLNILIYQLIAFVLIFSVLYGVYQIILGVSKILQKILNMTIIFALPSKMLGALIGIIGGYIVIFAILLVLMIPIKNFEFFSNSKLVNKIIYETPVLSTYTGNITNSIKDVTQLTNELVNGSLTVNDANLKIIDSMLKYKIVSKKTIDQLIVLDKLKKVKGLDNILVKYE